MRLVCGMCGIYKSWENVKTWKFTVGSYALPWNNHDNSSWTEVCCTSFSRTLLLCFPGDHMRTRNRQQNVISEKMEDTCIKYKFV